MTLTPQKVRAVLRKAGLPASKYVRSRQVRGYGHTTNGYRVAERNAETILVEWAGGGLGIVNCRIALQQAGFDCVNNNESKYMLLVTLPVAAETGEGR